MGNREIDGSIKKKGRNKREKKCSSRIKEVDDRRVKENGIVLKRQEGNQV